MANPVLVECLIGEVNTVATNVTKGFIIPLNRRGIDYRYSYRMTGEAAPDDTTEFYPFTGVLEISADSPIDVYLYVTSDTVTGITNVRVDL